MSPTVAAGLTGAALAGARAADANAPVTAMASAKISFLIVVSLLVPLGISDLKAGR
jgi:hypothetical protein